MSKISIEEQLEVMEEFIHTVAHDLQSPLKKISSFAGLAREYDGEKLTEKGIHCLNRIEASARKASTLVAALLEFSKQSSGVSPVERTDMNDLIKEVLSELELQIEESGARIEVDSMPVVLARPAHIFRVLLNLLQNAMKYRGALPPRIKIAATQNGEECIFSISDNGAGIDPSEWKDIFNLFRRVEKTEHIPGSGIGLSICKRIIEKHGGRIWVTSKVGEGSTFCFTLPLHKSSAR